MGSSVSSERAFSSAGITITKRRNRLGCDIVEALQVLKAAIRDDSLAMPHVATGLKEVLKEADEAETEVLDEDDEDDDELGKLMSGGSGVKRRNSSAASVSNRLGDATLGEQPNGAHTDTASPSNGIGGTQMLRRKGSLKTKNQGSVSRFAIKGMQMKTEQENKDQAGLGEAKKV